MTVPHWLTRILDHYNVPHRDHQHAPIFSAQRLAEQEHISGQRVAKTVFLYARGHPLAVVLPACARLNLSRVQAVLGLSDLRLASETEIAGWFRGCNPGAVPPLKLRPDEAILMDRSLAHLGDLAFAGGTAEDTVVVRFRDWYRAVHPGVGRFAQVRNHPDHRDGAGRQHSAPAERTEPT